MTWQKFVEQRDLGALALWTFSMALALLTAFVVPQQWRGRAAWLWLTLIAYYACRLLLS